MAKTRKKIELKDVKKRAASLKEKAKVRKKETESKKKKIAPRTMGDFGFPTGSFRDRIAQELAQGRFKIRKIQKRLGLKHDTPIRKLLEEAEEMKNLKVKYDGDVPVLRVVKSKK